jgi:hypothetical protein
VSATLRKQRSEAAAAPAKRANRFVEYIGEPARRRTKRECRELRRHLRVEALDDADDGIGQLVAFERAEMGDVSKPCRYSRRSGGDRRALQRDVSKNQLRQQLGQRD